MQVSQAHGGIVFSAVTVTLKRLAMEPLSTWRVFGQMRRAGLGFPFPHLGPLFLMVRGSAEAYKRLAVRAELREPQALIDNASFGPEVLKVIGEAFDEAWTEIADNSSNVPVEREAAQVKLATALLSATSEDCRDPDALKTAALERMKANYRDL